MDIQQQGPSQRVNQPQFTCNLENLNNSFTKKDFALQMNLDTKTQKLYASFSNMSFACIDLEKGFNIVNLLQKCHNQRINDFFYNDNLLITCSNDRTVLLRDVRDWNKIIKQFNANSEIYTISLSNHFLAGGGQNGKITFWNLQKMKQQTTFKESHQDDVTKLAFHKQNLSLLLSGSVDGLLNLFDLQKENEEDALESMIRLDQPINDCGFIGNSINAYSVSTVNTISLIDIQQSKKINELNTIENNDLNQKYLIKTEYDYSLDKIRYFIGENDKVQEYLLDDKNNVKQQQLCTTHTAPIRCLAQLNNIYITGSEDSTIQIHNPTLYKQINENMFDEEASNLFQNNDQMNIEQGGLKQQKKQYKFDPFKKK